MTHLLSKTKIQIYLCVESSMIPCNGVRGDSGAWVGGWMERIVNPNTNLCVSGIEPHYLGVPSPYSISYTVKISRPLIKKTIIIIIIIIIIITYNLHIAH